MTCCRQLAGGRSIGRQVALAGAPPAATYYATSSSDTEAGHLEEQLLAGRLYHCWRRLGAGDPPLRARFRLP
jgi:hypothetical protein